MTKTIEKFKMSGCHHGVLRKKTRNKRADVDKASEINAKKNHG